METLTITLDDDIAARARDAAAREGKSLSGYVADVLGEKLPGADRLSPLDRILALPLMDLSNENGRMPSRDEIYAERTDQLLRRHQRPSISEGQQGDSEASDGAALDRIARSS